MFLNVYWIIINVLNKVFNDDPAAMVREFETAVKSLAVIVPQEPLTGHIIQETWRNRVPAKDHAQIVRTSEAVLDAYLALRQGNVARGMARLALLLAAMEQSVLDEGKWNLRAATLLGLPPAPIQNYRAPTAEQKPSGENKLGPLAQFCSADRSTTALAVYRDNHTVTNSAPQRARDARGGVPPGLTVAGLRTQGRASYRRS